jgi:hypothetical protein
MSDMDSAIEMMNREDAKLADLLTFVVPVNRGAGKPYGAASYSDSATPPAWDAMLYGEMLTGVKPQPVVTVGEKDAEVLKRKENINKLRMFHDYEGWLYKAGENPANLALLNEADPSWLKRQMETQDKAIETLKRVNRVTVGPAQNVEDLHLLFSLGYDPTKGIGEATDFQMGWNEDLIKQVKQQMIPGIGKGFPVTTDATTGAVTGIDTAGVAAAFQRGIFNINKQYMQTKALVGYPQSIMPPTDPDAGINWANTIRPFGSSGIPFTDWKGKNATFYGKVATSSKTHSDAAAKWP